MNIAETEIPQEIIAKTCGCNNDDKTRKVTYYFVESYHSLCRDKKDIIISEIQACERLKKYTSDDIDKCVIATEIEELKMTLDLLT